MPDKSRRDSLHDRGLERSVEGKAEHLKGKMKDAAGDLTGDRKLQAEGKMDQVKGKAKDMLGKAERAVSDRMNDDDRERNHRR